MLKKHTWYFLIILLTIVLTVFVCNKTKLSECDKIEIPESSNTYDFIANIETENTVCVYNHYIGLYRCNNILEEEYNSHGDLIYIKTSEKETNYSYLYNKEGLPYMLSFDETILSLGYDDSHRINSIIYINENHATKKIKYEYNEEMGSSNIYPLLKKISIYDSKDIIISTTTFEAKFNWDSQILNIKESSYNSSNINVLTRFYNYDAIEYNLPYIFNVLNYIPEAYYFYNPFYILAYQYANYDSNLTSLVNYVNRFDKIIKGEKEIKYYYEDDYIYDSEFNFIIFKTPTTNGRKEANLIVYKEDNKYYRYEIITKNYKGNTYYEIFNTIEINIDQFQNYIKNTGN